MMSLAPIAAPVPQAAPLTAVQKEALAHLHKVATQFEGIFVDMLLKSMRNTVPKNSIFGKQSLSENVFGSMLDQQRAQAIAASGSFGLAKVLEQQMRSAVLGDAAAEAKTHVRSVGP